jgi:hypothetical protein
MGQSEDMKTMVQRQDESDRRQCYSISSSISRICQQLRRYLAHHTAKIPRGILAEERITPSMIDYTYRVSYGTSTSWHVPEKAGEKELTW